MHHTTEKCQNIIIPIILNHIPNAKVILYGSRARQDATPGSDIDIAIDMGEKIDPTIMSTIRTDLDESALPINFDVIDFHTVSKNMQDEIIKDGVVWQK